MTADISILDRCVVTETFVLWPRHIAEYILIVGSIYVGDQHRAYVETADNNILVSHGV